MSHTPSDTPVIEQAVGERIRATRQARGMEIQQLAQGAGLEEKMLERIEAGQEAVSATCLLRLARCFQVTPNYFFEGLPEFEAIKKQVADENVQHLLENFLKIDTPGRGGLFKQFIDSVTDKG